MNLWINEIMITVAFDMYNENEFVSSHEKTFEDEDERRSWFSSQMGHPFLSYCNERVIDNKDDENGS